MEIKVYTVKLDPPRWLRNLLVYAVLPLSVLIGGALAVRAGVTLITFTAGEPARAKDVNDNFAALNAAIDALQQRQFPRSAFHAWVTDFPSIPSGASTAVVFDHEEFDLGDEYDAGSGVFVPKQAGQYLFTCQAQFDSIAVANFGLQLIKNDDEVGATALFSSSGVTMGVETNMLELAAGDSVTCATYQETGSAKVLSGVGPHRNSFSGTRLY